MTTFYAPWIAEDLDDLKNPLSLTVLSVHEHAINLLVPGCARLVILADIRLYRGPSSIGLDENDFQQVRALLSAGTCGYFHHGSLHVGSVLVDTGTATRVCFS
ncbi:MAG: hypothetical protein N3A02_07605, partial [Rectinema sp.]|nr:hypothetical protein [Rectinema sp.]